MTRDGLDRFPAGSDPAIDFERLPSEDRQSCGHWLSFPSLSACCPASRAANFARSAGERVSRASASDSSEASAGLAVAPSPCPWWPAGSASALSFSGLLVQTLVQTGAGVGVSPLSAPLTTHPRLLPKLDVAGPNPVSRS